MVRLKPTSLFHVCAFSSLLGHVAQWTRKMLREEERDHRGAAVVACSCGSYGSLN